MDEDDPNVDPPSTDPEPKAADDSGLLNSLRTRMRALEKENKALKKAEDERESAKLSEIDQLKRKLGQAESERDGFKNQIGDLRLEFGIRAAAQEFGAKHPGDLVNLLPKDGISLDESGQVIGVEAALKAFRKSRPDYFTDSTPKPAGGGGGNPPGGPPNPKTMTRSQLLALRADPAKWKEAQQELKAGAIQIRG